VDQGGPIRGSFSGTFKLRIDSFPKKSTKNTPSSQNENNSSKKPEKKLYYQKNNTRNLGFFTKQKKNSKLNSKQQQWNFVWFVCNLFIFIPIQKPNTNNKKIKYNKE
jgi:hypothetical protein